MAAADQAGIGGQAGRRIQRDLVASRATALLRQILRREVEGDQHELVGMRQELSHLHAGLFDTYMATRNLLHR